MPISSRAVPLVDHTVNIPSFVLVGKMASGKDTYAAELKEQEERRFGVEVHRLSSSPDVIAEASQRLCRPAEKSRDRSFIQQVGVEMSVLDPGIWGRRLAKRILLRKSFPFIVDALRSPEDVASVRETFPDVLVLRVEPVDDAHRLEAYLRTYGRPATKEQLEYKSEKTVMDIVPDAVIVNSYQIRGLREQVTSIVDAIDRGRLEQLLRNKSPIQSSGS